MRATLQKSELLRGRINFQQVFEKGKKVTGKHLRCFILQRSEHSLSPLTVGFVVRRTVSRAVDRNRLKRLLRESYRINKSILQGVVNSSGGSLSIILMYAPQTALGVNDVTYSMIEGDMKKILTSISQQYLS